MKYLETLSAFVTILIIGALPMCLMMLFHSLGLTLPYMDEESSVVLLTVITYLAIVYIGLKVSEHRLHY